MRPPIIVDNFGLVLVFESVQAAERYIEPIDVLNNEYVLYDSEGRLLRASVTPWDRVVIQPAEAEPTHARARLDHTRGLPAWTYRAASNSILRTVGRVALVAGITLDALAVGTAGPTDRNRTIGGAIGGWGGGVVGGSAGTVIAPGIGTVIGALIGGFAGSIDGEFLGSLIR